MKHQYRGPIYPINPRGGAILGLPAYRSVRDLPERVDLAIIGVAREHVASAVEECAATGARVAVIVTSGFAENGEEGRRIQEGLVASARAHGMRIVGPNCMGVYAAESGVYASVALNPRQPGGVALLSQSGNVGVAMFEGLQLHRVAMHSFIGVGNQADVSMGELIAYLAEDPNCTTIAAYVEGIVDGSQLLGAVRRCSRRKPVVLLHGGREAAGAKAARSHTGALATQGRLVHELLGQCGGIVVDDLDDLITTTLLLSKAPVRRSGKLAIVTDGGGFGVLAADQMDQAGLAMAQIQEPTRALLREVLPPHCSVGNPIDVGGDSDSDPSVFGVAAAALLADPGVDALLVSGIIGGYASTFNEAFGDVELEAAEKIALAAQHHAKPVVVQSVWPIGETRVLSRLDQLGVPVVESVSRAVQSLARLDRYVERLERSEGREMTLELPRDAGARAADLSVLTGAVPLNESEIYGLLEGFGLSVPKFRVVSSGADAVAAAEEIGYPVVLKALVIAEHKSELGGVVLGVADEQTVMSSVSSLRRLSDEVLVAEQKWGIAELLVGGFHSEHFGPVVTVGVGGMLAEAIRCASFASAPVSVRDAEELLMDNVTLRRILSSRRRGRPLAVDGVAATLVAVSTILTEAPVGIDIELNPIIVDEEGAWVADAKLQIRELTAAGR